MSSLDGVLRWLCVVLSDGSLRTGHLEANRGHDGPKEPKGEFDCYAGICEVERPVNCRSDVRHAIYDSGLETEDNAGDFERRARAFRPVCRRDEVERYLRRYRLFEKLVVESVSLRQVDRVL